MPLYKYSDLTEAQKKLVSVMYSDLTNLEQYLYNFDEEKYAGRQYAPPSGVVHAESIVPVKDEVKEKPVKKMGRPKKK